MSAVMSGNASRPGDVQCQGLAPQAYFEDIYQWPRRFEPGKPNPMELLTLSYVYPDKDELDMTISLLTDGDVRQRCEAYRDWAWPSGGIYPQPLNPRPSIYNEIFEASGLGTSDASLTLMQALELYSDKLPGHATAGLFNAIRFGTAYGYKPKAFMAFLRENDDPYELLKALRLLNSRG